MSSLTKLAFNAIPKYTYVSVLQNSEHISNEIISEMSKKQRIQNVKKMKIWANSIVNVKSINSLEFEILHLMDKFLDKKTNFLFQENKKFPKCTLKNEMLGTPSWNIFTNILKELLQIKTYIHEFNPNFPIFVNDIPRGFPFEHWTKENWLVYHTFAKVYDERISHYLSDIIDQDEEDEYEKLPEYIKKAKNSILFPFLIYKNMDATRTLLELQQEGY